MLIFKERKFSNCQENYQKKQSEIINKRKKYQRCKNDNYVQILKKLRHNSKVQDEFENGDVYKERFM